MRLTIFAATGGIGRHLLEQSLARATTSPPWPATRRIYGGARLVAADLAAPNPVALATAGRRR